MLVPPKLGTPTHKLLTLLTPAAAVKKLFWAVVHPGRGCGYFDQQGLAAERCVGHTNCNKGFRTEEDARQFLAQNRVPPPVLEGIPFGVFAGGPISASPCGAARRPASMA